MKLLLVDGYSLLFRAYFSSPPLTTREGQPTGALYGFSRMLVKLLDDQQPDYALVALDAAGPTFRHDADANYKAHRSETPEDLRRQLELAREMLSGLSIAHYEHTGFEADDILGTLARVGDERGMEVLIVTGDGDALQLVNEHVSALLTRKGVSDLACYTPIEVQQKFGFAPPLVPDFKGLRGDSSDNIPGVPGIGDKTAMSLIGKFGGLEAIYGDIAAVTPPRIAGLLTQHREAAFSSRQLARIVTDLPVDLDFESCRRQELTAEQREAALATVRRFEFKSMLARFSPAEGVAVLHEDEPALAAMTALTLATSDCSEALAWLQQKRGSAVALLCDDKRGLVFGAGGEALYYSGAATALRSWLEDPQCTKIVHDAKCLKLALCNAGVALSGVVADTLLMAYLLDPVRQVHPLPALCEKYLRQSLAAVPATVPAVALKTSLFEQVELGTRAGADAGAEASDAEASEAEASAVESEIGAKCGPLGGAAAEPVDAATRDGWGATACALAKLAAPLQTALEAIGESQLFAELELPLVDVLVTIERNGMLLDVKHLRTVDAHLTAESRRLQAEIWEAAGEEFNIGSTRQLQVLLFEKLGLARGRTTKTGHSTDAATLERLAEEHIIVRKILDYRTITKLKSTYVDALLRGMDKSSHRVHTNLNQTGAVSGRLSSSDPNLQNIPIRTEQGRLIRKAFIAPPGHVILAADYSQIELRILAHITGDPPLVEAFRNDEDVHVRTAADLFGVAIDQVDSDMRRKAKMTNYAIAYGVSGFGLAKQLGSGTPGEAAEFIKRYFVALPGVKKYMDDTLQAARADGYVQTLKGRRRPLPEIVSPRQQERAAAERTAINHPIQGSAADIMKIAMLAIASDLQQGGFAARMTMQVHDELVFEVPVDELPRLAALVKARMRDVPTQALGLSVPLEVEVESGPNWNDTEAVPGL